MDAEALILEVEHITRHQAAILANRWRIPEVEHDFQQSARIALWKACGEAPAEDLHRVRWATVVIKRAIVDELRRETKRGNGLRRAELEDDQPDDQPQPCAAAGTLAVKQAMHKAEQLPTERLRVLNLLLQGLTGVEVAERLGISSARVHQQREQIRVWIGRYL